MIIFVTSLVGNAEFGQLRAVSEGSTPSLGIG